MILDFRNRGALEWEYTNGACFIENVEIRLVFYVDTERGFVRTYDVFLDGKCHFSRELSALIEGIQATDQGVLYREIKGKVDVRKLGQQV